MKDFFNEPEARYLVLLSYSPVNETRVCDIEYSPEIAHCGPSPLITMKLPQRWTKTGKSVRSPSISLI